MFLLSAKLFLKIKRIFLWEWLNISYLYHLFGANYFFPIRKTMMNKLGRRHLFWLSLSFSLSLSLSHSLSFSLSLSHFLPFLSLSHSLSFSLSLSIYLSLSPNEWKQIQFWNLHFLPSKTTASSFNNSILGQNLWLIAFFLCAR